MAPETVDLRDLHIEVSYTEEEARFLAGLLEASIGILTKDQLGAASRVAGKFLLAGEAFKTSLTEHFGAEAVRDAAERAMAAHPDIEVVPSAAEAIERMEAAEHTKERAEKALTGLMDRVEDVARGLLTMEELRAEARRAAPWIR